MTALSDYLEGKVYDHTFRNTALSAPSAIYAQLHTGAPGETGASNVLGTAGAARLAVTFAAPASRAVASDVALNFGPFTGDPPAVTHVSLWDAATNGNCLAQGAAGGSVDADINGMIQIAAGALTVAFAQFAASPLAEISTYLAHKILNLVFRAVAWTPPTSWTIRGYTSSPAIDDSGSELSGNGYAAQAVTPTAATDGVGSNTGVVVLGPVTGSNWSDCTHLAIKDQLGNLLLFGAVTSFQLNVGQSQRWNAGELVFEVA